MNGSATDSNKLAQSWSQSELMTPQPKLVFLDGEMGAGKTTFVTQLAECLVAPDAASPSYALHTRYEGTFGIVDHFDLDRLENVDDLESIGFWDLIDEARSSTSQRFVMIEWAKRLDEFQVGSQGAAWTKGFRVWSFYFTGPPSWEISAVPFL